MKRIKKYVALLLVFAMVASLAGCGSSKESSNSSKNSKKGNKIMSVDVSAVKTLEDAVKKVSDYSEGEYELKIKLSVGDYGDFDFDLTGKLKGNEFTVDSIEDSINISIEKLMEDFGDKIKKPEESLKLTCDSIKLKSSFGNVCTLADGKLYFDIDEIVGTILKMDTDFGSYGILVPVPDADKVTKLRNNGFKLIAGVVGALGEEADVDKDDTEFTIRFESAEDMKKAFRAAIVYIQENSEEFVDYASTFNDLVDFEDYAERLTEDIQDDIEDVAEYAGQKVPDNFSAEVEDRIKDNAGDINSEMEDVEDMQGDLDYALAEMLKEFDEMPDSEWAQAFDAYKQVDPEITFKTNSDEFAMGIKIDNSYEGIDISADIEFSFVPQQVSISAPKKVSSMEDILDEFDNIKDDLQEKYDDIADKFKECQENEDADGMIELVEDSLGGGYLLAAVLGAVIAPSYVRYITKSRQRQEEQMNDY